jgi:hypothetical protein
MALPVGHSENGAPFRGGEKKPFDLTIGALILILSLCRFCSESHKG